MDDLAGRADNARSAGHTSHARSAGCETAEKRGVPKANELDTAIDVPRLDQPSRSSGTQTSIEKVGIKPP